MNEYHKGCPNCRAEELPQEDQPYPGTHAFSIRYRCGSQVVYIIAGNYWEYEKECPVELIDDGK